MKWSDLKTFVNTLTPEQLDQEIYIDNGYTGSLYSIMSIESLQERVFENFRGLFYETDSDDFQHLWDSEDGIKLDKGSLMIFID